MSAIASTDVTVTCNQQDRNCAGAGAFKDFVVATVAFGNGSLTYPTNGVPLPAIGYFGLHKGIDFVAIQSPPGDGFVYKYDATNHTIRIYAQGIRTGSTSATTPGNGALVENSLAAETAARIPNTAVDTDYDFGPLKEIGALAIAAVTLKLLIVGQ